MPQEEQQRAHVTGVLMPCPFCAASMPETAVFCPACGRRVARKPAESAGATPDTLCTAEIPVQAPAPRLDERLAAMLAYLTFVPAVVFLFLQKYRRSRFVRFHAWQSVFMWAVFLVLLGGGMFLPSLGPVAFWLLLAVLFVLAAFFLFLVLAIKACQGEWLRLPLLGELAEKQLR